MKTLVIGGGGREHALAWRLSKSESVSEVHASPGNPGIARVARCHKTADYLRLAEELDIELTVVGPEAPLVAGVVDAFRAAGRKIVGPSAAAAALEGSKIYSKNFMQEFGIPTARYETAFDFDAAHSALRMFSMPLVLKADGLAGGKGVVICSSQREAIAVLEDMFAGRLVGDAGRRVVIEEFLEGEEVSFIAFTDGKSVIPFLPSQDHKAVADGDMGPNTGGMGAYCDSRILSAGETNEVLDTVIYPTLTGMESRGTPFTGFLYAGLMRTQSGFRVLEFNVRLGDPEAQPLMFSMDTDLGELFLAAARGHLATTSPQWKKDPAVCVVVAAKGYPGKVTTGDVIHGIQEAEQTGSTVFQGSTQEKDGVLETAGGRVLGVTSGGATLQAAIDACYRGVEKIQIEGCHYRKDIGRKGLARW